MINKTISAPSPTQPLSRNQMLTLMKSAILVGERKYARRAALAWLSFYPGDLEISLMHAQALLQEENSLSLKQALHILEELCIIDPEYLEAQKLLTQAKQAAGFNLSQDTLGYEFVLRNQQKLNPKRISKKIPKWAIHLKVANQSIIKKDIPDGSALKEAKNHIHQALSTSPDNILVAVKHLDVMRKDNSLHGSGLRSLAEAYHNRWPKCVQFILHLADLYMLSGNSEIAVTLLHKAVSADITGQVALRHWGVNHPYKSLWPDQIEIDEYGINTPQSIPVPAAISAFLGWNQLPDSTKNLGPKATTTEKKENLRFRNRKKSNNKINKPSNPRIPEDRSKIPQDEFIKNTWDDLHKLASKIKQPEIAKMDGRFPVYVIMSTKTGLTHKYGKDNAQVIVNELKQLVTTLRGNRINHRTWGSILFLPDDVESCKYSGINPVPYNDPWGIKLALADLEKYLETRGEMIGALLIVGCHDVVPFHYLPNPVDDDDVEVASDNPYATSDGNYFVQEWPVGRIPGDAGKDPGLLLHSIKDIHNHYQELKDSIPWFTKLWNRILNLIWPPYRKIQPSLGYSAAVWRRASFSVYRTIGQPKSLYISPPTVSCESGNIDNASFTEVRVADSSCISITPSFLAYFNLHGLQDAPEWYGQSDPTDTTKLTDFPVALRPRDIINGGRAPKIVFSEACYGAHIKGKLIDEAIALKFLASGSRCVIGSSCISYGSIRTPLIGADLLGHAFWKYLVDHIPVGEALRRAKIHLINEMNKRQGYLDGEDQKTLISFILYGDPLTQPFDQIQESKLLTRSQSTTEDIKTLCARKDRTDDPQSVPDEIMTNVKHVVSHYLPGMRDANVSMGIERTGCQNACRNCLSGNLCPTAQSSHKNAAQMSPEHRVVTLSKSIHHANYDHRQFAHITLDKQGKVVKLAVSR